VAIVIHGGGALRHRMLSTLDVGNKMIQFLACCSNGLGLLFSC
jgi:hypothetical protein